MARTKTDDDLAYVPSGMGADLDTLLIFNLMRTGNLLSPFIDANLRRQHLTSSQFNALLVLRSAGPEGLRMGDIGQRLVVTKSNVTGLVDRLQRQGLVARAGDRDRRATVVHVTRSGADLLERAAPRHARIMTELTGRLSGREKRSLVRLLTKVRRELRRAREGRT